ncbi:hypothetical protein OEA41_000718 [Lepraria neglecta]|uniref:Uncharacterized protein n=1 Tax=Lepraria neglecta TaxID=209136 RepID=A0AAD9ZHQ2_9LECA|nr:hypothetical protein OEA41_000718 [Lepraria neglecta]
MLGPGGSVAVFGSSSSIQILITPASFAPTAQLTIGGSTYTANPFGDFFISGQTLTPAGQTLKPGGSAITVSHTPVSIAAGGTVAIIGRSSQLLALIATTTEIPVLTFCGSTYIVDATSAFVIDGQTLTKGGTVTVQGTALSFDTRGTDIVIESSTQILGTATITNSEEPTITLGGQIYTENVAGNFLIGGQSLTSGGVITVSGTPISFGQSGTDMVVGTSTEPVELRGWIMSGFGSGAAQTGVVAFDGKGTRWDPPLVSVLAAGIAVVVTLAGLATVRGLTVWTASPDIQSYL